VDDACIYDSDGNGSRDKNWAVDWQNSHTEGVDWYNCGCAHSDEAPLNCNQKAYGVWALWASLAGWNGGMSGIEGEKTASQAEAFPDEVVTYTSRCAHAGTPPTGTAPSRRAPRRLAYVPLARGHLLDVDDTAPAHLAWSGTLRPRRPHRPLRRHGGYHDWRSITNSAVMQAEGIAPITRTAPCRSSNPKTIPTSPCRSNWLQPSSRVTATW
jgi:hypothetical protein